MRKILFILIIFCAILTFALFVPNKAHSYTIEEQYMQIEEMKGSHVMPSDFEESESYKESKREFDQETEQFFKEQGYGLTYNTKELEHASIFERYEKDENFKLKINYSLIGIACLIILSIFAGFVGLSQKTIWTFAMVFIGIFLLDAFVSWINLGAFAFPLVFIVAVGSAMYVGGNK